MIEQKGQAFRACPFFCPIQASGSLSAGAGQPGDQAVAPLTELMSRSPGALQGILKQVTDCTAI
jgi:hypothetical protein